MTQVNAQTVANEAAALAADAAKLTQAPAVPAPAPVAAATQALTPVQKMRAERAAALRLG